MVETLNRQLAQFVRQLDYGDIPKPVVERIKNIILHDLAIALASYDIETAQVAIDVAKEEGSGRGEATIIVDGTKVATPWAAFANATMCHSREEQDMYHEGLLHPGIITIPAVLATSEKLGVTGGELLTAITAGFEVGARLSKGFCKLATARGHRSTPTFGVSAVAAAVGKLLDLSEDQLVFSLGWGANLAFGISQCGVSKTPEMPIQVGLTSQHGIIAAQLGKAGAIAAEDILEGSRGLYFTVCGSTEGAERITSGLGQEYWMMDTCYQHYPVGGMAESPVQAVLALIQENPINPEDIEEIQVIQPGADAAPAGGRADLKPGLMNVPYCVSVACVHKKVTLRTVADMDNPQVRAMMPRVKTSRDPTVHPPGCRVTIKLKDNRILSKDNLITYNDYCYSFDEERRYVIKSLLPDMPLPKARVTKMIELVANIENLESVKELMETLSYPGKKGEQIRLVF